MVRHEEEDGVERVLFSEDALQTRVRELGASLSEDYQGKDPLVVCVLTGGKYYSRLSRVDILL